MTTRTSATRYARALLDVLLKESTAEQGAQDLATVSALLTQFPDLQRAFNNPAIPAARKRALVQELLPKLIPCIVSVLAERVVGSDNDGTIDIPSHQLSLDQRTRLSNANGGFKYVHGVVGRAVGCQLRLGEDGR